MKKERKENITYSERVGLGAHISLCIFFLTQQSTEAKIWRGNLWP